MAETEDKVLEENSESQTPAGTSTKRKAEWFEVDESRNTYVYVNGLPLSLTEDEFVDLMKRYGLIKKKATAGQPYNVKLYKDKDGNFKGDALCCFAKVESVELAVTLLDGYAYDDKHTLHCERAKFSMKGQYDPSKKPRVDVKLKQKQKKTLDKLTGWDEKIESKQKTVILKNMFAPDEIGDASDILDLKDDVEKLCSDIHCIPKRVDVYDNHPEGVISVTFAEFSQAEAFRAASDKQFYAQRVITAELWDGRTKYKIKETDDEEQKRLEKFEKDIQASDDDDEKEAK